MSDFLINGSATIGRIKQLLGFATEEETTTTGEVEARDADILGGKYKASHIDGAMTYDAEENTTEVDDVDIIDADRLGGRYTSDDIDLIVNDKQSKTDTDLETTDKTVVGAINEVNNSLTKLTVLDNQTTSAALNATSTYAYPSGVSSTTHALLCIEVQGNGVGWRSDQIGNVYMKEDGLRCAPTADTAVNRPLRIVYVKIS